MLRIIARLIQMNRFQLTDEKRTQAQIAEIFTAAGVKFDREVRLSDADIVDFMVDGEIAIEVKIKGQRKAIYRQLERYSLHGCVKQIMLVTSVSMNLPPTIGGKTTCVASLSQGWL